MFFQFSLKQKNKCKGLSAILYVIASAILMITLTAALSLSGSEASNNVEINGIVNELRGGSNIISLQINKCLTTYSGTTNGSTVGTQFDTYPAHDVPTTLSSNPSDYDSFATLKNIECPGARQTDCASAGAGTTCSTARIWAFSDLDTDHPLPPAGFTDWQYQNQPQWVALKISTSAGGWQLKALQRLASGTYADSVRICDTSTPPYALFVLNFYDDGGAISSVSDIPCS